jgi:ketosteroid isomerase-like protein
MTPEQVVRTMWEAINARDYARVAGAIAERCEWVSVAAEQTFVGPEAMVRGARAFAETYPDGRTDIEQLYVCGDVVVIEWRTSGTRADDGATFSRRGCSVAEVRGGKITAYRDYFDRQTLEEQLRPSPPR